MLGGSRGLAYVLEQDRTAVLAGSRPPEPLVLHVNVGDCLEIRLRNETEAPVSLHADLLAYDPAAAGPVPPDAVGGYTFFAHPEVGETAVLLRDTGNVLENPRLGLYGAVIVGAPGTRYSHPATGEDLGERASWAVDAHPVSGPAYRGFALFLQDEDEVIGTAQMPYREQVHGLVGLNYGKEPLARRLVASKDTARLFRSAVHGDPAAPLLEAFVGDRVRLHLFVPFSEQAHVVQPGGTPLAAGTWPSGHGYAQLAAAGRPGRHDPPSGRWRRGRGPEHPATTSMATTASRTGMPGCGGSSESIARRPGSGCSAWSDRERWSDQRPAGRLWLPRSGA